MLFIQCINEKITYILGFIIRKAFFRINKFLLGNLPKLIIFFIKN
jgi:hypothetical protein